MIQSYRLPDRGSRRNPSGGDAPPGEGQPFRSLLGGETPDPASAGPSRDELVERFAHLVKYVVGRLGVAVAGVFDREDALQVGTIGLLAAIDRYDPASAASFESYAIMRIRGSILDAIRSLDAVGRAGRQAGRAIQDAIQTLTADLNRMPEESEIADRLGVTVARYRDQLRAASTVTVSLSEERQRDDDDGALEDVVADPFAVDPEDAAVRADLIAGLAGEIRRLTARQQLVMSLYYRDTLTFREIGEVLGVAESRVCQIHTEAVLTLRGRILEPDLVDQLNRRRRRR
jgi:RNA polymerase sigma factor for flagellar operon FliA